MKKLKSAIWSRARRRARFLRRDSRGVLVGITAVFAPILLAFLGLAIDVGYIYDLKRREDKAAVAGAMSAGAELWRGNETSVARAAGKRDAKRNGFNDGDPDITVTVNIPPTSGPNQTANFAEVLIEEVAPTYFMHVINRNYVTVRSRAVAGLRTGADGCVYALNPTVQGGLTLNGGGGGGGPGAATATTNGLPAAATGTIAAAKGGGGNTGGGGGTTTQEGALVANCGVIVNSSDPAALKLNGSGVHLEATEIGVTGGVSAPSNPPDVTPTPITGISPALDPLAFKTAPTVAASCDFWDTSISSGVVTLNPGRYCAHQTGNGANTKYPPAIEISGGDVTFSPGLYILDSGMKITGNGTVTATETTFYVINTVYGGIDDAWNDIDIGGTANVNFTAPTSGEYAGMLFWIDSSSPAINPGSVIAGDSNSVVQGTIYAPSANVNWRGTSTMADWTMIVADTIEVSGNAYLAGGFENSDTPLPTRKVMLVE